MTVDIEQIKRECFSIISLTDQPRVAVNTAIDHLVSRGYLGVVPGWQPIETYDYKNFPEVWLAAWIEPSEYAKENGASAHWDIGMGRCWHVNTRKFTGVLGGSPIYWCKTNKPYSPAQKGNAE